MIRPMDARLLRNLQCMRDARPRRGEAGRLAHDQVQRGVVGGSYFDLVRALSAAMKAGDASEERCACVCIAETLLIVDRQVGHRRHERLRKHPGRQVAAAHRHLARPAAWRARLQDEA
jgi:hypothetical protein